jgi:hypothetical protein
MLDVVEVSLPFMCSGVIAVPDREVCVVGFTTFTTGVKTFQSNVTWPMDPTLSVARTMTMEVPDTVGVPLMTPVDPFMAKPVGSWTADQVNVEPGAESVAVSGNGVMATFTCEVWRPGVGIVTLFSMIQVKVAEPLGLDGSEAVTVTVYVPLVVGVPLMTPVDEPINSPGGRVDDDQVIAGGWVGSVAVMVSGLIDMPLKLLWGPGLCTTTGLIKEYEAEAVSELVCPVPVTV